jgi:hypothetical protein
MGVPLVLMVRIGRFIAEGAGANEEFEMETVTGNWEVAWMDPTAATTLELAVQLVFIEGLVGGNPSWPAVSEAFKYRIPDPPEGSASGVAVTPEGRPVIVILMVAPELLPVVETLTGTFC